MPGDGRAIDYYVIWSNAALFISWLPSCWLILFSFFFVTYFIFYYITKSLLVFSWWFSLSYCGLVSFTLHFDAWILHKKKRSLLFFVCNIVVGILKRFFLAFFLVFFYTRTIHNWAQFVQSFSLENRIVT